MRRTQTATMKRLLRQSDCCELCRSRRNLEVHHIIPISFGGPEDDERNMIVVCHTCHSALTPHGLLTSNGLKNAMVGNNKFKRFQYEFYKTLDEIFSDPDYDPYYASQDIFNCFDKLIDKFA